MEAIEQASELARGMTGQQHEYASVIPVGVEPR
jgi:hypothetical protein